MVTMSDAPEFHVKPTIRCFHRDPDRSPAACARQARWMRPGASSVPSGYFCDEHVSPGDVPIPATVIFRRVSVQLEVLFSATDFSPGMAQAEAVAALERAVERVGGVINLHTVTSVVGRYASPAPLYERLLARSNT